MVIRQGGSLRGAGRRTIRARAALLCALGLLSMGGCHLGQAQRVGLPTRYKTTSDQLLVRSNFKLPQDDPLLRDLAALRKQVSESLQLPLQSEPVVVYLFRDQTEYNQYMQATYPDLPPRRAYFIATSRELAVYGYWGDRMDRIQEDLRHEYTHGLLHSAMSTVPLWLDEGLAEYFEVSGPAPGELNRTYANQLAQQVSNGWRPDLDRLEKLEKVEQMHRAEYREAWAWVHFMLHSSPDTRQVLLGYLQDLRTSKKAPSLSSRLREEFPELDSRFLTYIVSLQTPRRTG